MRTLSNRRVLITGAGRGIGRALALRFAREGADVVVTDIDLPAARTVAAEIEAAGGTAAAHPLDVTDADAVATLRDAIRSERCPVHVLVNNAGTVHGGPFVEVPLERHLTTFRINVDGVVTVTRAFLADLIASDDGHLVNIASASGLIGLPFGSTYAASKWAVIGFSDSIRLELGLLGHRHVGVTAVCPSYVDTGLFEGARPPRTTRMLTPERLAGLTVRAVLHNRPYVRTPWLVKITPLLKGVLPTAWFDALGGAFGANRSMSGWTGHGDRPANPGS
jgi:short-subunit dehydrogenase